MSEPEETPSTAAEKPRNDSYLEELGKLGQFPPPDAKPEDTHIRVQQNDMVREE